MTAAAQQRQLLLPHQVRRSCRGCGAQLPPWPVIVAACPACTARLPAEIRDACEHGAGAAWCQGVDAARAWLVDNPR